MSSTRGRAKAAACVAVIAGAMLAPPAPAAAAVSPISIQAISSCFVVGLLQQCRTSAIEVNPDTHCVEARLSGSAAWGNVYDITLAHVGPTNFIGARRICGLYNFYYLVVRNVAGMPGTLGVISS
jgi:hypothetical protein